MNGCSVEAENPLATMPLDKLMKIATEGPVSSEERWREERERQTHEEIAHMHARLNAMTEIIRRGVPPMPEYGQGHASIGCAATARPEPCDVKADGGTGISERLSKVAHELEAIACELAA